MIKKKSFPFGLWPFSFKGFTQYWDCKQKMKKNKNIFPFKKWSRSVRLSWEKGSIALKERQYRCSAESLSLPKVHPYYTQTPIKKYGSRYSWMDQVKFFKGCLLQILLGSFVNTLTYMSSFNTKKIATFGESVIFGGTSVLSNSYNALKRGLTKLYCRCKIFRRSVLAAGKVSSVFN